MGKNRNFKNFAGQLEGELNSQQPEEHSTEQEVQTAEQPEGGATDAEEHSTEQIVESSSVVGDEQSTELVVPSVTEDVDPVRPEGETETLPVAPVMVLGIGQFVRQMMLKSTKTNTEILALVHQLFPEAKTTPACIAWYKSDLRKKGLLQGPGVRASRSVVNFTQEMLDELTK